MRLKAPGTYAAVDRGVAHLCIVVGDDVWMMLGARQVAVGDLHRNTKLGNGVQASREKKQRPHSTLKTFAALLDLTQVVVRADPCEGSLVREPLFKEDTQRNFPISFGRLASTGGCATRCGLSPLAFTVPSLDLCPTDAATTAAIAPRSWHRWLHTRPLPSRTESYGRQPRPCTARGLCPNASP